MDARFIHLVFYHRALTGKKTDLKTRCILSERQIPKTESGANSSPVEAVFRWLFERTSSPGDAFFPFLAHAAQMTCSRGSLSAGYSNEGRVASRNENET